MTCGTSKNAPSAETECTTLATCLKDFVSDDGMRVWAECERDGPCEPDCFVVAAEKVGTPAPLERLRQRCTERAKECDGLECSRFEGVMKLFAPSLLAAFDACLDEKDCAKKVDCLHHVDEKSAQALIACLPDADPPTMAEAPAAPRPPRLAGDEIDARAQFGEYAIGRPFRELHGLGPARRGKTGDVHKPPKPTSFGGLEWTTKLTFEQKKLYQIDLARTKADCSKVVKQLETLLGEPNTYQAGGDFQIEADGASRPVGDGKIEAQWKGAKNTVLYAATSKGCSITVRPLNADDHRSHL